MTLTIEEITERFNRSLSGQVSLHPLEADTWGIATPFTFPDGDSYSLYLQPLENGGWKLTDLGHTWMVLSYENDVDKFRQGNREELRAQILRDSGVEDRDGELCIESSGDDLGRNLFKLIQVVTRVHDLTFLNRERVAGTFDEDLQEVLRKIVPFDKVTPGFQVTGLADADKYPVDFMIPGSQRSLFVFGVTGRDKARLVTIYLQHYLQNKVDFDSLCILRSLDDVPKGDLHRLVNAGGEMAVSLDDHEALSRKILKKTG